MHKIIFVLLIFILVSCQEGLEPISKANIQGKIRIVGELPADSLIKDLRVVAFQKYPPQDIVTEVLTGRAIFTESLLPIKNKECNYMLEIENYPITFEYFVVARQWGTLFEWDVVAIYTKDTVNYTPEKLVINKPLSINIDFIVDFSKKLPQPF